MNCPICSYDNTYFKFKLFDDRYGYPGFYDIRKCRNCDHHFLNDSLNIQKINDLYTNYYPRNTFKVDRYKPYQEKKGFSAWLNGLDRSAFRWVPKNIRVLDIGCGFGESLGYHEKRGCDAYGVEADENITKVVDKYGFNVHVGLFRPDLYKPAFFDFVTMDQVIEHIVNPIETLKGIATVLKSGGVAILSTPNANGWGARTFKRHWINWHVPYHIQFFSKRSMRIAAEKAGLKIKTAKTITSSEWLLYQWIHLFTYPKSGDASKFWDPRQSKDFRTRLALKLCSLIHASKIDHFLTRFFDMCGLGDNYLFILHKT